MGSYAREELVADHGEEAVLAAEATFDVMNRAIVQAQFHVFEFYEAPETFRRVCNFNGGDEDWMVITYVTNLKLGTPMWVEKMDTCRDPDVYEFNGFVVYVGNHA